MEKHQARSFLQKSSEHSYQSILQQVEKMPAQGEFVKKADIHKALAKLILHDTNVLGTVPPERGYVSKNNIKLRGVCNNTRAVFRD